MVAENWSGTGTEPARRWMGRRRERDRRERGRRRREEPASIRRNWAASAPAMDRIGACQAARSFWRAAEGPGMRRWSWRSLRRRKMERQVTAPAAEMWRRYSMLPYQAAG